MDSRSERLGLEPGSVDPRAEGNRQPMEREVAHSIAISLKRIADVLTGTGEQANLYNLLTDIAWQAGQSFERGRGAA